MLDNRGILVRLPAETRGFLFSKTPRGPRKSTQPPVQFIPVVLSRVWRDWVIKLFTTIWCQNQNTWNCTFVPPLRLQGLNTDFAVWAFSNWICIREINTVVQKYLGFSLVGILTRVCHFFEYLIEISSLDNRNFISAFVFSSDSHKFLMLIFPNRNNI